MAYARLAHEIDMAEEAEFERLVDGHGSSAGNAHEPTWLDAQCSSMCTWAASWWSGRGVDVAGQSCTERWWADAGGAAVAGHGPRGAPGVTAGEEEVPARHQARDKYLYSVHHGICLHTSPSLPSSRKKGSCDDTCTVVRAMRIAIAKSFWNRPPPHTRL